MHLKVTKMATFFLLHMFHHNEETQAHGGTCCHIYTGYAGLAEGALAQVHGGGWSGKERARQRGEDC